MSDFALDYEESVQRAAQRRRGSRSLWLLLLMLAWLIYELTARPALAIVVCCFKFGWEDLRTALWLRRRDLRRGRAWASCLLYLAFGLWKTACIACLLMLMMVPLFEMAKQAPFAGRWQLNQDLAEQAAVIGIVLCVGLCLASITTLLAVTLGAWSGCKLWVDGQVHWDRRENRWPPSNTNWLERKNRGLWLALPSLILLVLALTIPALVSIAGPIRGKLGDILIAAILTIQIGLSIVILVVRDFLSRRIFARSPGDCWTLVLPRGDEIEPHAK
jgi:hypothetical protein